MRFQRVCIPYGHYWSTPFCKWQGSLSEEHSLRLLAAVGKQVLSERRIDPAAIDSIHLGYTIPQPKGFYGAPWVASLMGLNSVTGPTLSQACATGARTLCSSASAVEVGGQKASLAMTADRTSNGPHLYFPRPGGPGGTGQHENVVIDNIEDDPVLHIPMLNTAENLARRHGFGTAEQNDVALLRYRQYEDALAQEGAFHRRFMIRPLEVLDPKGRVKARVFGDEGIHPMTGEGVAKLKPVRADGTVTFAHQTHPADGNCGILVCEESRAREWAPGHPVCRIIAFGEARADPGYMGEAPVPAAQSALSHAGVSLDQIVAIKTHNPFVVNDLYFARATGCRLEAMNRFGSSLIFGHPQGPTGMRLIIELIEELVLRGGGLGLFTGCAAGDSAAAMVVQVT